MPWGTDPQSVRLRICCDEKHHSFWEAEVRLLEPDDRIIEAAPTAKLWRGGATPAHAPGAVSRRFGTDRDTAFRGR